MAQIEDPHPWSPFRWLLEITFNGMLDDFPAENYPKNPNYREELFTRCVECCQEEWHELTPDQKQQFIDYAEKDERENGENAKKTKKKKKSDAPKSADTSNVQVHMNSDLAIDVGDEIKNEPTSPVPIKTSPTKKQKKKPRDPNKPKQAMSAFFIYMNTARAEIKASNPDMTNPQISTEAAKRWKEMTEEDKRPYNKQAEIGKQKHDADMVEYKRTLQTTEA